MAGGPGWLQGLTGAGRTQTPAAAVPPALAVAPSSAPSTPSWRPETVEPRLAMPTQETHTEPPPLVLDERVNPPTPPEREGLEGSIAGTMWHDPIALLGAGRDIVQWGRPPLRTNSLNVLGQYAHPRNLQNRAEGVADTIRFQPGMPAAVSTADRRSQEMLGQYYGPITMQGAATGYPDFPEIGRHEFRHRGFHNMRALARAYNIPFNSEEAGLTYMQEPMNIFADREQGLNTSYPDVSFDPVQTRRYNQQLYYLRDLAGQINAARVQQMHDTGLSWTQTGRTME
jgi:hypothetical protein